MNTIQINKEALVNCFTRWTINLATKYWKEMFKSLNVVVIPILESFSDKAFMAIHPIIEKHGVKNQIRFQILINMEYFCSMFEKEFETGKYEFDEYIEFIYYQFNRILLHELRHAAQDKHIFCRLNKNKKAFRRYKIWERAKYASDFHDSAVEKDAYDYQDNGNYGREIFKDLDFLDQEIAEFLNK